MQENKTEETEKNKTEEPKKKTIIEKVEPLFPMIRTLVEFLTDCYAVFDSCSVVGLESFIGKYRGHSIDSLSQYAKGLFDDYDAVRNCLVFPEISNGPIEGCNNRIKMIKRRSCGKAGVEMLNAYAVLLAHKIAGTKANLDSAS